MGFKFAAAIALVYTFLSVVSAMTYNVSVGENNEDDYNPRYLNGVKSGDIIHFSFVSQIPHTVTQSTFDQPCARKSGAVDSGVLRNTSSPSEWSLTITSVAGPLWYYCAVGNHCSKSAMVFAINPTSNQTFDAFRAKSVAGFSSAGVGGPSSASTATTRYSSTSTRYSSTSTGFSSTSTSGRPSATPSSGSGSTSGDIKISIHKTTAALAVALVFVGLSF